MNRELHVVELRVADEWRPVESRRTEGAAQFEVGARVEFDCISAEDIRIVVYVPKEPGDEP